LIGGEQSPRVQKAQPRNNFTRALDSVRSSSTVKETINQTVGCKIGGILGGLLQK